METSLTGRAPSPLLDLPPEVRLCIYQHLFAKTIITLDNEWGDNPFTVHWHEPNLLQTCQQIHKEGDPILYQQTEIQVMSGDLASYDQYLTTKMRKHVKNMTILYLDLLPNEDDPLRDLDMFCSLKHLELLDVYCDEVIEDPVDTALALKQAMVRIQVHVADHYRPHVSWVLQRYPGLRVTVTVDLNVSRRHGMEQVSMAYARTMLNC